MPTRRKPLQVVVTWTDARSCSQECEWDLEKVAQVATLYHDRRTIGYLVYVDHERIVLAHDWDEAENLVGNFTVIPVKLSAREKMRFV